MVRADAGGIGPRAVGRRSGRDSGPRGAAAEDGQPGCGALAGSAGGEPLSPHLGAFARGARLATTAEASGQSGADADVGEEPTALPGDEPRGVPETKAVERARPPGAGRAGLSPLGDPATPTAAAVASRPH